MDRIERKFIDWKKTGTNLRLLRNDNIDLRRYICRELKFDENNCSGDCASCKYDMDASISRNELAEVFNVSESVVFNWESGRTPVSLDDLVFYTQVAKVDLFDILVFTHNKTR